MAEENEDVEYYILEREMTTENGDVEYYILEGGHTTPRKAIGDDGIDFDVYDVDLADPEETGSRVAGAIALHTASMHRFLKGARVLRRVRFTVVIKSPERFKGRHQAFCL